MCIPCDPHTGSTLYSLLFVLLLGGELGVRLLLPLLGARRVPGEGEGWV